MATTVDFDKDASGWNRAFGDSKSGVGRYLYSQARGVERLAKANVLKKTSETGRLAASIEAGRVTKHPLGMEVEVTADAVKPGSVTSYAYMIHEGTKPHTINPRQADGVLMFPSNGMIVFTEEVHHPGTKGNPYLADALIAVTRHWDHVAGKP